MQLIIREALSQNANLLKTWKDLLHFKEIIGRQQIPLVWLFKEIIYQ